MGCERVIVYVDKTVVKVVGLKIDRINLTAIEKKLLERLNRPVRVIGVSGAGLEFDVYEFSPAQVFKNEGNIVEVIANEGITGAEVARIVQAEQVPEIAFDDLVSITAQQGGCTAEKWLQLQPGTPVVR
ncbi:hypothetical protein [Sporomusa termitida]|uniref:Uncharacterized protein n=1 Tax=Sporomusa termitida TaxID=2377 RepID=A0A517DXD8_9FIRM|nr:hypothetical protein [Sporomusa termitida]QDR81993.1 hypothetical protein SPTER_34140 [Sporomusa termitida]